MTEKEAPKIEFPCDYPIKVMGVACEEFQQHVLQVFSELAPDFDSASITVRDSRKGNFQSMTVTITATGTDQLQAIFEGLKASSHVQMVL